MCRVRVSHGRTWRVVLVCHMDVRDVSCVLVWHGCTWHVMCLCVTWMYMTCHVFVCHMDVHDVSCSCVIWMYVTCHVLVCHIDVLDMSCVCVSDGCVTYLTANTIEFTRSYLSFCDDLLKVYTANRHQLITSAFTDILTAHVNCLHRAANADKFKNEVGQPLTLSFSDCGVWHITHAWWLTSDC